MGQGEDVENELLFPNLAVFELTRKLNYAETLHQYLEDVHSCVRQE